MTDNRRRGRPPRTDTRAIHTISLRCDAREYDTIARLAEINNCSLATVLRLGVHAIAKDSADDDVPMVFDDRVVVFRRS